jgi:hypothetical protein
MKRTLSNLFWSRPKKSRPRKAFRPSFEGLEDRRVMAGLVTGAVSDAFLGFAPAINSAATSLMAGVHEGTLYVRGTDSGNTITLRQKNDAVSIDGLVGSYNVNNFNNIVIRSFGGNDVINLKSEGVKGQQAITKATEIWGGIGLDNITGGRGNDNIFAEAGNDKVWGNLGDDIIDGGADADELRGEVGRDKIFGDIGADKLWGGDNDDFLVGGDAADYLYGGNGLDMLDGSLGNDFLYGEADYDYLYDNTAQKTDSGSNYLNSGYLGIGWFDRFVENASLRTEARFSYAPDFSLNRTEMIDIFDVAESSNVVDSGEFADLKDIVGSTAIVMPEYVRSLADNVVNGDVANSSFQGTNLGNLAAGDSGEHLEDLVDKWFFGLDRPVAQWQDSNGVMQTANYQFVQGSLFQNGVAYTDISQGAVGDCYFMAALGSVALREPWAIQSMFIDNGDNTFTVRFYDAIGTSQYVTVDRYLPTRDAAGDRLFASYGTDNDNATNELWVALAEKAYAQINESGWIGQETSNSYQGISGGWPADAMAHITGHVTSQAPMESVNFGLVTPKMQSTTLSKQQVIDKINLGRLLAVDSKETPVKAGIPGNHAFTVVGYNSTTDKFTVFNPWGYDRGPGSLSANPAEQELTWSEIVGNFRMWDYT